MTESQVDTLLKKFPDARKLKCNVCGNCFIASRKIQFFCSRSCEDVVFKNRDKYPV